MHTAAFFFEAEPNTRLCIHSNEHIHTDARVYSLNGTSAVCGAYSYAWVMETWRIDTNKEKER